MLHNHDEEIRAYKALRLIAEVIVLDIMGDRPDIDTAYDLCIGMLNRMNIVGVINMGDAYQGVYSWSGTRWVHDDVYGKPSDMIRRIRESN